MLPVPRSIFAKQVISWSVHCYTALGLVAAALMAVFIINGHFRWAFAAMFVSTLIDATDGTLARWIKVKEVLPGFDGRRLDDIIDFHTYTSLPLLLLWRAAVVPSGWEWSLVVSLLASVYGFCQVKSKTDDGYFLGFPSYWNLVALYLYLLPVPGWLVVGLLIGLALLTFVPSRYLYPSQGGRLNMITNALGGIWCIMLIPILIGMSDTAAGASATSRLTVLSLLFPLYYLLASWWITVKIWLRK